MKLTPEYDFELQEESDNYDVGVFNNNFTSADRILKVMGAQPPEDMEGDNDE